MTTKYLRQDIHSRFWRIIRTMQRYDSYTIVQIYSSRRVGTVVDVSSVSAYWKLGRAGAGDDIGVTISRQQHFTAERAMLLAYLDLARHCRTLKTIYMDSI